MQSLSTVIGTHGDRRLRAESALTHPSLPFHSQAITTVFHLVNMLNCCPGIRPCRSSVVPKPAPLNNLPRVHVRERYSALRKTWEDERPVLVEGPDLI
ncbi:hypothetical protein BaRGS_00007413 [Batillaria attramentaria]|uniref:Uncharacterized protein n=1 Tax=Batillaria attramentaria TaxID=370345 RepID=A0ABD0LQJ8_9CAEN